ncbi:hypothetical protein [Bordetella petrii]|uniref:hypothetical protein n=1 Tax=Bordetella petrii TaxID=94624 RepID=UPI00372E077C
MPPHIVFLHVDSVPAEYFQDFIDTVRADNLDLQVVARPSAPMAGVEWLMPTVILAYLAKPYFESFLTEMGKDHYELVKAGLKKLYKRVAGPESPEVTLIATGGKVNKYQPYSLFFSVVVEGLDGERIKLLIPRPIDEVEYRAAIDAFLDFAEGLHVSSLDGDDLSSIEAPHRVGSTVLVAYDSNTKKIRSVDPLASRRD